MPKKHQNPLFRKPVSTSHPSLSTQHSGHERSGTPSGSVNDVLNTLRRTQLRPVDPDVSVQDFSALATGRTVHPSLTQILHVVETPPPRPRTGPHGPGRNRRGPAGPPPPTSWLLESMYAPAHARKALRKKAEENESLEQMRPQRVDHLPDLRRPNERSLVDLTLRQLARDWALHVHYDQYHLATLPSSLKATLLGYIAVYGPDEGVGIDGLRTLFLANDDLPGASDADDVTHLDLSRAIGPGMTIPQLSAFLLSTPPTREASSKAYAKAPDELLDSWETASPDPFLAPSLPGPRFPSLTHLSLGYPAPTASWTRLLSAGSNLHTLTHLSLAYWPVPSLTPNAKTTTLQSAHAPSVNYGASDFYSAYEGDWSEAAGLLRRLSRATYCLRWLDLCGCGEWFGALKWAAEGEGAEWNGAWRRMDTIVLRLGKTDTVEQYPDDDDNDDDEGDTLRNHWRGRQRYEHNKLLSTRAKQAETAREAAAWVRKKRAAAGGIFCRFELDE